MGYIRQQAVLKVHVMEAGKMGKHTNMSYTDSDGSELFWQHKETYTGGFNVTADWRSH